MNVRVPREGGRSDVRSELVEMLLELKERTTSTTGDGGSLFPRTKGQLRLKVVVAPLFKPLEQVTRFLISESGQ